MIIGMDWLESFNPMLVHWKNKWLSIPYQGSSIVLHGDMPESPVQLLLQVCSLDISSTQAASVPLLPAVQSLLDEFSDVFQPPDSLPPSRACNHVIPLIPRAQPFYIRPYRNPPVLKDEIERQVKGING